jgi:hypothetical protein
MDGPRAGAIIKLLVRALAPSLGKVRLTAKLGETLANLKQQFTRVQASLTRRLRCCLVFRPFIAAFLNFASSPALDEEAPPDDGRHHSWIRRATIGMEEKPLAPTHRECADAPIWWRSHLATLVISSSDDSVWYCHRWWPTSEHDSSCVRRAGRPGPSRHTVSLVGNRRVRVAELPGESSRERMPQMLVWPVGASGDGRESLQEQRVRDLVHLPCLRVRGDAADGYPQGDLAGAGRWSSRIHPHGHMAGVARLRGTRGVQRRSCSSTRVSRTDGRTFSTPQSL